MNDLLGTPRADTSHVKFLLDQFAAQVPGIAHVVAVGADGLLLASTDNLTAERGERLGAIVAGLCGLAAEANNELQGGGLEMTMVEMRAGYLIAMHVSDGSRVAVLANANTDIGQIAYQLQQMVDKVGEMALSVGARHG